ncbi:MAG: tetratricopeptide repeat protein [Tepidisphaeraceae bacterium]|jgi:tetratricopeptide (TPR) repeat protein
MNTHVIRRIAAALVLWAALAPGLCVPAAHGQTESTNIAGNAYKLRMLGKVGEARTLLEKTIREDPRDAAANYELARTMVHIALGDLRNPRSLTERLGEAQQCMAKAEEDDPNNVIYPFFDGHIALLQAYPSLMQNRPDTREKVVRLCGAFESALKLKPDYRQAMLYLVEIYGTLPENQGGDKSKAEKYARQLEGMDAVFGAKARSILMPGPANNVDYWQTVLQQHEGDADVLEELGKAYLRADKVDDAVACFEEAIKVNPGNAYLFLDLSIYHTWSAMQAGDGSELFRKAVAAGDAAVTRYLDSTPVLPMRAYALGVQYKYKLHSGHKGQADELLKQAEALDPYFSKATGTPNPDLFIPPDEVSHNHRYLFRPIQ